MCASTGNLLHNSIKAEPTSPDASWAGVFASHSGNPDRVGYLAQYYRNIGSKAFAGRIFDQSGYFEAKRDVLPQLEALAKADAGFADVYTELDALLSAAHSRASGMVNQVVFAGFGGPIAIGSGGAGLAYATGIWAAGGSVGLAEGYLTVMAADQGIAAARGYADGSFSSSKTVGGTILDPVTGGNGELAYGLSGLAVSLKDLPRQGINYVTSRWGRSSTAVDDVEILFAQRSAQFMDDKPGTDAIHLGRKAPIPLKIILWIGIPGIALLVQAALLQTHQYDAAAFFFFVLGGLLLFIYQNERGYRIAYDEERVFMRNWGFRNPLFQRLDWHSIAYRDMRSMEGQYSGGAPVKSKFMPFEYLEIQSVRQVEEDIWIYPLSLPNRDLLPLLEKLYEKRPDIFPEVVLKFMGRDGENADEIE